MHVPQLGARDFSTPGHAFGRCIQRPLVGFAPGPGEMPQVGGEGEPLGAGERLHFTLYLQQGHAGKLPAGNALASQVLSTA